MTKPNGDSLVILCPYCGNAQAGGQQCEVCGGLFEPLSRKATQISMGPWYLRDLRNPFRPGCSYEVIKKQAKAGRIKPTTVMRGPTTRQFWSVARNVPGVAHLIGYCHACSEKVGPGATTCPQCGVVFAEPGERNELGLMYATEAEAQKAQRHLNATIARDSRGPGSADGGEAGQPSSGREQAVGAGASARAAGASDGGAGGVPGVPGADLLDEVFGDVGAADGGGDADEPRAASAGRSRGADDRPAAGASSAEPEYADLGAFAPLDFTPSDDTESLEISGAEMIDQDPTSDAEFDTLDELAAKNNRLGVMTWVLIGVNVAILLLVGVLFINLMNKPPSRAGASGNGANAGVDVRPQDEVLPFSYQPPAVEPPDSGPDSPGTSSSPDASTPAPGDVEPQPDTAEQARLRAEAAQREQDRLMHNEVAGAVNRAEAMRINGNLEGALAELESIRKNYPPKFHPPHLNTWISNTRKVMDGDKNPTFFGVEGK